MFRDKDYLLTAEGLIFNVLGDQHAPGQVTVGLKYVQGTKFLDTYAAAAQLLRESYPQYVTDRIVVPVDHIEQHLKPLDRTRQLQADTSQHPPLLARTLDLIEILAQHCDVPASEIGITDSLLWGEGNENSDIDLVIYGRAVVSRFLNKTDDLFQFDDIERITPEHIQRPPYLDDHTFQVIADRKANQGTYRGTRFTIRGVLTDEEVLWAQERTSLFENDELIDHEMEITAWDESLLYPIVFDTNEEISLATYHIGYEMGFKPGDRVHVRGTLETSGERMRILVGSIHGGRESITLVS